MEFEFVFHRRDDDKLVKVQMVGAAPAALGDSSSDAGFKPRAQEKFYFCLKKISQQSTPKVVPLVCYHVQDDSGRF